ncbi:hypothetical protein C7974DRAFT_440669 [Boeremia exigua]|uniref:uncharacterized protein n=1 Tax=Boeremia exigua TaxID=749465 RepID=UPI001E8ED260|nr:uncharacterized protein C7974DRAFT_440669 [Boeremia exigua]KAH6618456.1 hypothetical protein C7974DRAFT_440669 [Boeremia exigua]
MPTTVQDILKRTWRPPLNTTILPADHDKHYKPWGFVLYRTCYSPASEPQWHALLASISSAVLAELGRCRQRGEDPDAVARVEGAFTLDVRSDPTLLDSLAMDEVCALFRAETGNSVAEMRERLIPHTLIFLLADGEVLENVAEGVVKVVQAAPGENADPEDYCQWMRVHAWGLVEMWVLLGVFEGQLFDLMDDEGPGALWTV